MAGFMLRASGYGRTEGNSALQESGGEMTAIKPEGPDDLMTAVDAGRILGVSVDTVRLLAKDGRIPFMSTVRGVRLFRRADVERLAAQRAGQKGDASPNGGSAPV